MRGVFRIPCNASFIVPSPPNMMRERGLFVLEVISSAMRAASPACLEKIGVVGNILSLKGRLYLVFPYPEAFAGAGSRINKNMIHNSFLQV